MLIKILMEWKQYPIQSILAKGNKRGIFYNFAKNFQAKLNKNEWNIYTLETIDKVDQIGLLTTCITKW